MRIGSYRAARRRSKTLLAVFTCLALAATAAVASPASAEDSGFWYGADSAGPGPSNGSAPYTMPSCGSGHAYGGYIGKIGGADLVKSTNPTGYGPGHTDKWNSTYAADANANHFSPSPRGVGAGGFWWMFGPNDTLGTGETPYFWGNQQATWALQDWQRWYDGGTHRMPFRILWADVETGANGWSATDHHANREVFNGFFDAITNAAEGISPGVYSTQVQWDTIMSGNTDIPNTWEWTAQVSVNDSPSPCPTSFSTIPSTTRRAVFFGGQTASSPHAAIWQWSQGALDYDQINANKNLPD